MSAANPFNLVRAFREFGIRGTAQKLWQMRTIKFGRHVGTDINGNKYFENNEDYPMGQNRWVEYAGYESIYYCDPSTIPAEWHLWLHQSTEDPPTDSTTGSTADCEYIPTVVKSDAPFTKNLGGVVARHTRNESSTRPRGFGLSNAMWSEPDEEKYYTQPGWAQDPRNKHARPAKRAWTLADTAETLRERQVAMQADDVVPGALDPTFGLPSVLPFTEAEEAFVAQTGGRWDLSAAYAEVKGLKASLRVLEDAAEFNPRQTEEPLAEVYKALEAAEARVSIIEAISAKWVAAGGVGSANTGLP